jgi:hypothetical protein
MVIEKGDLFMVVRGREKPARTARPDPFSIFIGEGWKSAPADAPTEYDSTYCGCVWEAMEVCGLLVAAKCVCAHGDKKAWIGKAFPINVAGLELMTVTKEFAAVLAAGATPSTEPKPESVFTALDYGMWKNKRCEDNPSEDDE